MKPILILMVGIQGSGKTTIAKRIAKLENFVRVGVDDIKEMIGHCEDKKKIRRYIQYLLVSELLKEGYNVILDRMALSKEARKAIIERYRPFASKIIAIFVNTPIDVCFKRNQNRPNPVSYESYLEHLEDFEHPTKDEGFDEIIEVNNA